MARNKEQVESALPAAPIRRRTVREYATYEFEVKRSTFIGYCKPVLTKEEADAFVDEIRKKHSDARHNVYAWVLKKNINLQKYSDDGEPSGTAGLPVMSVLTKNGLTDIAVVVTRYFGGILLGKGGLMRAYTKAASEAVKKALPVTLEMCAVYKTRVDYKNCDKLIFEINNKGWTVQNVEYGENVEFINNIPLEKAQEFTDFVFDVSSGTIMPEKIDETEAVSGEFEFCEEEIDEAE